MRSSIRTPVIQFGTSRFLQAHADLFIHEAAQAGEEAGPVTVVASSGSAAGKARLHALAAPDGYPVHIRGMEDGRPVERDLTVRAIRRALDAEEDWPEVRRVFADEASFVISNTTESGFTVPAGLTLDLKVPGDVAPPGYPARLLALLAERHWGSGEPITVLPTELVGRNGDTLKGIVLDLARRSGAADALLTYIGEHCLFANSLVDRIVSSPLEPAGAVAEPYALWAVEKQPRLKLPCSHPAIKLVDDLERVERLKIHILNLGHTVLAQIWQAEAMDPQLTVKRMLAMPDIRARLMEVYDEEVLPGFALRGMGEEAAHYLATTLGRFDNPFLDHRLSDIASGHTVKIGRRIVAFLDWTGMRGRAPRLESIAALV